MSRHLVPYDYQKVGAKFMLDNPRCNLWAGMGLGKTSMVLSVIDMLMLAGSGFFPALVIAPKRVAQVVWTGEQEKWDAFNGIKIIRILGDREERIHALKQPKADVYVINYDNIQWLVETLKGKWPFKIVVADESTKLKNFRLSGGGARSTALSKIAKSTGRWINLTGTPATNGLTDLWGPQWFVDYGSALGRTYTQFNKRWFLEDPYTRRISPQDHADQEIYEALKSTTLALRTEDCLKDIIAPEPVRIEVELPTAARKLYDQMEEEFFVLIGGPDGIEAPSALVLSTKLLQLASGAIYDTDKTAHDIHDAKIEALQELNESTDENLLVAYHFKFDAARIMKAIKGARIIATEQDIDDWNAGKIKVGLGHPQSMGHGINLAKGGRNIVFFTHTFNLELRQQITERLGAARQSQLGNQLAVRVFDIVAKNTIDVEVLLRTDGKLSVQQALMIARSRRGK